MIDISTEEWREALHLVQAALDAPGDDAARAAAFDSSPAPRRVPSRPRSCRSSAWTSARA